MRWRLRMGWGWGGRLGRTATLVILVATSKQVSIYNSNIAMLSFHSYFLSQASWCVIVTPYSTFL